MITRRDVLTLAGHAGVALSVAQLTNGFAVAQTPARGKYAAITEPLDAYVRQRLQELGAPGLTMSLVDRSGVVRVATYGYADVETKQAVTPDHLFEIGSITKSFGALCTLQMADEGKLDLARPITEYVPWLQIESSYAPITLHHLLSHTSGLPDDAPLFPRGPFSKLWVGYAPGNRYSYSNTGYQLIGRILERVEGKPLIEIFRRRVFGLLGMNASTLITNEARARMAVGYQPFMNDRPYVAGARLAEAPWVEETFASGGIASTPADMAQYIIMLLNRGAGPHGRVLSERSFDLWIKPVQKAPQWGDDTSYAYGWAVDQPNGHTIIHHTGGMVAFASALHADLTSGVAAFASVNAMQQPYRPNDIVEYALNLMRAAQSGNALPPVPAREDLANVPNASAYAGRYMSANEAIEVRANGNQLMMTRSANQSATLLRAGKDRFVPDHPHLGRYPVVFGRQDDKGPVQELFFGPAWMINERYTGPKEFEYSKDWEAYAGTYNNDDPWQGVVDVFLRKGKLWIGDDALVALGNGLFRPEENDSPERISFDQIVDGKAMRMNASGVDFMRKDGAGSS